MFVVKPGKNGSGLELRLHKRTRDQLEAAVDILQSLERVVPEAQKLAECRRVLSFYARGGNLILGQKATEKESVEAVQPGAEARGEP